jgi:hypothetical protein
MVEVMYTGTQGKYFWLEDVTLSFNGLLELCPEFVLGKYLVITSFDSGPLRLNDKDFNRGWLQHNELAINPSIESVQDIPYDEYDEWYIFSKIPLLEEFKVFVNYSMFSLRDPEYLLIGGEATGDIVGRRYEAERIKEMQESFWLQLKLKEAETYISVGDRLILATQRQILYEKLIESVSEAKDSV